MPFVFFGLFPLFLFGHFVSSVCSLAANIPRPTGLLSRMLVMLAHPKQARMYPEFFLNLLQCLASCFHAKLENLFQKNIPNMLEFLAGEFFNLK